MIFCGYDEPKLLPIFQFTISVTHIYNHFTHQLSTTKYTQKTEKKDMYVIPLFTNPTNPS